MHSRTYWAKRRQFQQYHDGLERRVGHAHQLTDGPVSVDVLGYLFQGAHRFGQACLAAVAGVDQWRRAGWVPCLTLGSSRLRSPACTWCCRSPSADRVSICTGLSSTAVSVASPTQARSFRDRIGGSGVQCLPYHGPMSLSVWSGEELSRCGEVSQSGQRSVSRRIQLGSDAHRGPAPRCRGRET